MFLMTNNRLQVLQSMQALVNPVRLQKLTIQPVNLLVSIHASLKLYIASDHTPLSFSLFERGPLCTTARQLVHALAMHYAAGALFRAGRSWTQLFATYATCLHIIYRGKTRFVFEWVSHQHKRWTCEAPMSTRGLWERECSKTVEHQKSKNKKKNWLTGRPRKDLDSLIVIIYCFIVRSDSGFTLCV